MAEFWTSGSGGVNPALVAAARAAGKTVVGAEAYTGRPEVSQYTEDPAFLKPSTDLAFSQGINRMILHHWFRVQKATKPDDIGIAHRQSSHADVFFVANLSDKPQRMEVSFRASGKQPELWQAEDGRIGRAPVWSEESGRTSVHLGLNGNQSVFVVFRSKASKTDHPVSVTVSDPDANWSTAFNSRGNPVLRSSGMVSAEVVYASGRKKAVTSKTIGPEEVKGPWNVTFAPKLDQPVEMDFPELIDFSKHSSKAVNYFAGTAIYQKQIAVEAKALGGNQRVVLDLGELNDIAEVRVNGKSAGVLWYPPYSADITSLLKPGSNLLQILVTINWANRLIGDEQEPADFEWGKDRGEKMGRAMLAYPDWFVKDQPRPSQGRRTFSVWNYFTGGTAS